MTQSFPASTVFTEMLRPFHIVVLALAAAGCTSRAAEPAALPKDSPFLPVAGSAGTAVASNESLTLAGVSGAGKSTLVCIYDTQIKRSYWIAVGSTTEGIKVLSYDADHDQVVVSVGGQQKTLTLRKASIANTGATTAVPPAGFAAPTPAVATTTVPTQGTPQPPPAPGSVAQQETEARMLVSDLLEIGMQQRKAYEEAQKKAQAEKKKS